METRNVTLTLEKAKEFYNSGNAVLKEVALQAYTKDELKIPEWQNIRTFEDACRTLNINSVFEHSINTPEEIIRHQKAIRKLDIIRKALNKDWKPSLVQGNIYYPYIRFYPAGQKAIKAVSEHKEWKLGESFIVDGKKYTLVGGGCGCFSCGGLANFGSGCGDVPPLLGLLGCKSRKIAEHMSRYFSKEIFEAVYTHHTGTYQWV